MDERTGVPELHSFILAMPRPTLRVAIGRILRVQAGRDAHPAPAAGPGEGAETPSRCSSRSSSASPSLFVVIIGPGVLQIGKNLH